MNDPWEKAYVYGRDYGVKVAHVTDDTYYGFCGQVLTAKRSVTPKPYPVCKNCLRTKRAEELGLP